MVPGLLLRAYASGYVKKNAELTVTGPYAYTRNPLYLGSMLMAFGFAAASRSLWITLAAGASLPPDLCAHHLRRRAVSAFHLSRLRKLCPTRTSFASPAYTGADSRGRQLLQRALSPAPRVQFTFGCLCRLRCAGGRSVPPPLIRGSELTVIRYPRLVVRGVRWRMLTGMAQPPPPPLLSPACKFLFPSQTDTHLCGGLARLPRGHRDHSTWNRWETCSTSSPPASPSAR